MPVSRICLQNGICSNLLRCSESCPPSLQKRTCLSTTDSLVLAPSPLYPLLQRSLLASCSKFSSEWDIIQKMSARIKLHVWCLLLLLCSKELLFFSSPILHPHWPGGVTYSGQVPLRPIFFSTLARPNQASPCLGQAMFRC